MSDRSTLHRGRAGEAAKASRFRHLFEAMGLALLVATVLLALAMVSYNSADPSANMAVDAVPRNILGKDGAWIVDWLFRIFGMAAALVPFILLIWSVRLLLGRGLAWFWLRVLLAPPMAAFAALALAVVPTPAFWPLKKEGLGGLVGQLGWGKAARAGRGRAAAAAPGRAGGGAQARRAAQGGAPDDARSRPRRPPSSAAARAPRHAAAGEIHGDQRGRAAAERADARDRARGFRHPRPDRESAAGAGGHALRARAGAGHQGLAHHRPRRRHRALDERDLRARRGHPRAQRHRHRAAQQPR